MIYLLFTLLFMPLAGEQKSVAIVTYRVLGAKPWDKESINEGITGSEEATIYLADALAKEGCCVTVFGDPPPLSPYRSEGQNPRYLPLEEIEGQHFTFVIAWRGLWVVKQVKEKGDALFFWPHDTPPIHKIQESDLEGIDEVLWLSNWQREQFIQKQPGFEKFKTIIGNGIDTSRFRSISERKNPHSCIWGSNYARGLDSLLSIWPHVRREFPDATLDIYYGWNSWGLPVEKEKEMRWLITALQPLGVKEHGLVSHGELEEAYERSSLWTYPCIAPETFCITALKAQYAGAIPVIVKGSALYETVRHGYSTECLDDYLSLLLQALKEAEHVSQEERKAQRTFIDQEFTWEKVAKRVLQLTK